MSVDYAYGSNTVERANILSKIKLPGVVSATETGMAPLEAAPSAPTRACDTPDPVVKYVVDLLDLWRKKGAGKVTTNQLRLKAIRNDTAREIAAYPRGPVDQYFADVMRENLYRLYLTKMVRGWDADNPPLILMYLVHTRQERIERLKAHDRQRTIPRPPVTVVSVSAKTKCIQKVLDLYDVLPGRWTIHEWTHGDSEVVWVRNFQNEGMIGRYLTVLHEPGDSVLAKINGTYVKATVQSNQSLAPTKVGLVLSPLRNLVRQTAQPK